VSFSSRDGNRSELMLVCELVEADGSLWRGGGVKSFNRGSMKRDEDVFQVPKDKPTIG
jgi:hypothetical protein